MKKFMYWWAKITSLVIIFGIFYSIHLGFSIVKLYFESQTIFHKGLAVGLIIPTMSLGDTLFSIFGLIFNTILGLLFYSPFFYYGWVKTPKSRDIKYFTQIITIIFSMLVIGSSLFYIEYFSDVLDVFIILALITPLYYFAWRKPKIS